MKRCSKGKTTAIMTYCLLVVTAGTPLLSNSDNSPLQIFVGTLPDDIAETLACNARYPCARYDHSKPDSSTFRN